MRKHKALFLFLLCFVSVTGRAQKTNFKQEVAVGFSGGATFSSVSFVPKVYQGMLTGYTGGILLRWLSENHLGLQLEANFVQQGWKEDFSKNPEADGKGYQYSRIANYVEMPFLTHIYYGSKRVRFFFNIGPKVGYLISESIESNLNGAEPNLINNQHVMPIENEFDWGLCGGPGLELRTGIGSFFLEGRYYYALGDLYGNSKADVFAKSSEQVLSVKMGYFFRIR